MNNKMITLTKALLKNGFGMKSGGKKNRQIAIILLVVLSFIPVAINLINFISMAYDSLVVIGQQGVILGFGIAAASFVIFFFGIFYVMNIFYFSNDVENLLPLPLKPSQIIGAKFLVTVIYEYITEAIILLPLFIVYAVKSGASLLYYLYALIVFLLVPFVPLAIASVLVMVIMRFTGIAKNRDRFRMIGGVIALFAALSINFMIQRFATNNIDPEQLQQMFSQGQNSLIDLTSRIFPGSKFGALSIVNSANIHGITNLLIFILLSVISFMVFQFVGELLYFRGVIGISEMSARRRKVSSEDLSRISNRKSKLKSYTLKELKLLFRTPVYFMNCVLMNFIWPALLIIPYISQSQDADNLESIKGFVQNGSNSGIVLAGGFAIIMFISASNGVTSSSISREGQSLYVSKYLPAGYNVQIMAKVLSGVVIALIGLSTMLIAASIFFRLQVYMMFLIVLTGLTGIFFSAFTGILMDLFSPKLHWDIEQKAVKQNLNVMLNMVLGVVFAGLTVWAAVGLKLDIYKAFFFILIVYGLMDIALYKFVSSKGVKLFNEIEA